MVLQVTEKKNPFSSRTYARVKQKKIKTVARRTFFFLENRIFSLIFWQELEKETYFVNFIWSS